MGYASSWTNEQWTDALADEFFSPKFAGEPVTLAVDDVLLAQISGLNPDDARAALASVVGRSNFGQYLHKCRMWRRGPCDLAPPSLPLLALNVLVASSMTKFEFYRPLRILLDLPGEGIPDGYAETMPEMWEQLAWWLDVHNDGTRGLSTIENHEAFPYIGYSLKQALFRGSDRTLLYRFFRSIRLDPDVDEIVPIEIRRALAIWSRRQGAPAHRLLRLATDTSIEPLADSILMSMAATWDGRLRDPRTGARSLPLRLMLTTPAWSLGLVAPQDVDAGCDLDVRDDDGHLLHLSSGQGYYEPIPLPITVTEETLGDGLELSGDDLSFFLDGADAVALRLDDALAAWVSTPQIAYGERHHLLVHERFRAATEAWLAREGAEGALTPQATRKLPQGWFLFSKVRINARPKTEPPSPIRDLLGSEPTGDRLRLAGGLRLAAPPRTYLTGGTPNIVVPEELRGQAFEIRTEGHDPIPRVAVDHEFELSAFDLQPGDYEIASPTSTLHFTIIDQLAEKPSRDVGAVTLRSGGATVTGLMADVSTPPTRPITVEVPADGTIVTLGQSSKAWVLAVPRWIEALDGPLGWDFLDAWGDADEMPAWQLTRSQDGWRAKPLAALEPQAADPDSQWARFVRKAALEPGAAEETRALWDRYVAAAEPPR